MSDWRNDLMIEYPDLFKYCSIDVGDGWENIIKSLCTMMTEYTHIVRSHNDEAPTGPVHFRQIKEKFGTLRIYASNVSVAQDAYISFAEEISKHVCETCGNPGKIRSGGWIRTLCDKHANVQSE